MSGFIQKTLPAGLLFLTACGVASREPTRSFELPIVGGDAATPVPGVAFVRHTQGGVACSGALIARDLLVTAKHCVFEAGPTSDLPLDTAGLRVGFGEREGSLIERNVDGLTWVGTPDSLSIEPAVISGEDVAVLRLSEAAPETETVRDIELVPEFTDRQPVRVAGFGLSDLETGESGVRASADGQISGLDRATGIVAISGPQVCFGDSGGPVLSHDGTQILGVVGEVGAVDAGFCGDGLSFADTAANPGVRRMLAKECARVGGCGTAPPIAGESGGAAGSDNLGAGGNTDSLPSAGEGGTSTIEAAGSNASPTHEPASGCQLAIGPSRPISPLHILNTLAALVMMRLRSRKHTRAPVDNC